MPDKCDPCICPDLHYRDSMSWRKAMLYLLCRITDYIVNPPTPDTNAGFTEMSATGFAAIGAAYALGTDLPDDTREVMFDNQTDADIKVSMDAGVHDTYWLQSGQQLAINFFAIGRVSTAIIHIKRGTVAATAGNFLIYAMG